MLDDDPKLRRYGTSHLFKSTSIKVLCENSMYT